MESLKGGVPFEASGSGSLPGRGLLSEVSTSSSRLLIVAVLKSSSSLSTKSALSEAENLPSDKPRLDPSMRSAKKRLLLVMVSGATSRGGM